MLTRSRHADAEPLVSTRYAAASEAECIAERAWLTRREGAANRVECSSRSITSAPFIHTRSQFTDYFLIHLDFHPSRTILLSSHTDGRGDRDRHERGAGCDGPVATVGPFARQRPMRCAPRSDKGDVRSRGWAAQGPSKRGGPRFSQSPLRCGLLEVASRKNHRVRSAGVKLRPWLVSFQVVCFGTRPRGRGGSPSVPHALSGEGRQKRPANPEQEMNEG